MREFFRKYEWEILLVCAGLVVGWLFAMQFYKPPECHGSDVPRYCVEG